MSGDRPARSAPAVFVDPSSPRSRRPLDATAGVVGLAGLLLAAGAAETRGPVERSATRLVEALPPWTTGIFSAVYALCAAYVLVVVLLVLRAPWMRARLLVAVLSAGTAAFFGTAFASLAVRNEWPQVAIDPLPDHADIHDFPAVGVAVLAAILLVLRPWMVLTYRRLDGILAAVLCVAAWLVGLGTPSAVLGALAIGVVAACGTLLVMGSPGGHPDLGAVAASLDDLGIRLHDLSFAAEQPWGARILYGTSAAGERLLVKVYGRDAVDAHRAARWWRAIAYREQTMPDATRLQMVEHEALVTLLAERTGVGATRVVAAAASRGDALIVLVAPPPSFATLPDARLDDDTLRSIWCSVAGLQKAGLSHGDLGLHRIGAADGRIVLSDFARGSVASSRAQLSQDTATLLTSQALRVGPQRAVGAALSGMDQAAVVHAHPYLQRAALPRQLRADPGLKRVLEDLRSTIVERTGASPAPPAPIVRVRWRDLLRTGLLVFAAYALVTILAQLDWATVIDSWAQATWVWVVVALIVAQLTSVADSMSTMSAVTARLPLLPLVHLQYAVKFVGLAISATAGRIALNTAFLRRFGEGPSVAVTASALDSLAGALVNVGVVGLALLVGGDFLSQLEIDTSGIERIVDAVVAAAVVSVVAIALVRPLRQRALTMLARAWSALRVVMASPARTLVLVGSNLVSLLVTAVSLSCMVQAIHPSLPFGVVVAVTAGAALFAAVVPVPGNVGAGEAALTAGLGLAGIPSAPAFAIAVTQRIATSYLPSAFGAYSLRWLRRDDYI